MCVNNILSPVVLCLICIREYFINICVYMKTENINNICYDITKTAMKWNIFSPICYKKPWEAKCKNLPGPVPWPIFGNLDLLGRYGSPFESFTEMSQIFGDIYAITLGTKLCLVVSSLDLIHEVLNKNGKYFSGRPDFIRFNVLFGGSRSNCEYTKVLASKWFEIYTLVLKYICIIFYGERKEDITYLEYSKH